MKRKQSPVFNLGKKMLLFLMVLAFPPALPAEADEAKELGIYLAQHGYGNVRVEVEDGNREVVEAQINGKSVTLIVDTGCGRTCLTTDCARYLGLEVHDSGQQESGLGGAIKGNVGFAQVTSFKLNNYEINRTRTIIILPPAARIGSSADGLLGFDYLQLNAVILPVGGHRLLYKPGTNPVPPIDNYMNLLGFKPIPLRYVKGGLRANGQINGQPLSALIDCGAAFSAFDFDYALKTQGANFTYSLMQMRGVDGQDTDAYGFSPKTMSLGSVSVKPMLMETLKAPVFSKDGFNALLGYDFLASHEAMLDLGHDTLWMQ